MGIYTNKGLIKHAETALTLWTKYMWGGILRPITDAYIRTLKGIYGGSSGTGYNASRWAELSALAEKGIRLALYEIPANKYGTIAESVKTLLVNKDKAKARFLVLDATSDRPEGLPPEAFAERFQPLSNDLHWFADDKPNS